jgi:hypothetical protein
MEQKMKITRKRSKTEKPFETFQVGATFIDDDIVFMVINELYSADGRCYNAICLESGELECFHLDCHVKPVETELIVEE